MRNKISLIVKVFISGVFLFIVLRKIEIASLGKTIKSCYLPVAIPGIILALLLSFLLSLRWFILIKGNFGKEINYWEIWKFTMIGLFFNNFLPTGAGGDIAKVYYVVKERERKLSLGSSVIVDRFIGAVSIITIGMVASFLSENVEEKVRIFLLIIFLFLLFFLFFLSNRKIASFFYSPLRRIVPKRLQEKIQLLYNAFSDYFLKRKFLISALAISFFLQIISIFSQYLMAISILWKEKIHLNINLFFIYIPLIWVATLLPSLGGLGIREFSYVFFFSSYMGKDKSFALSILVLLTIILQSIIGAIIFFTSDISSRR
ncbi:MAG: hypothetical protein DRP67_01870 [Candidatus Omnitrophota bacterium]|nr:MAG: hypothetical protein DRP67_01870 [Candidatus Omnitrophota bacterium]